VTQPIPWVNARTETEAHVNVHTGSATISPTLWEAPEMRQALAGHHIDVVYRLLNTRGITQRHIADLTGQHQSEVSGIADGSRQVQAYDVLARIAEGLGVPRGYLGLAYTDSSAALAGHHRATFDSKDHDVMERRTFLGLVGKLVAGALLTPQEVDLLAVTPTPAPTLGRVGGTEITQLRALTEAFRTYDATHGGGSCRDAILAQMNWAQSLLDAAHASDPHRLELALAVADLKTLAGWTAHDLGLPGEALRYLTQAVQDTQAADSPTHTAIVMHHLGRVPLDNGHPGDALKYFQLGQIAAQDSRSSTVLALLHADAALAHAHLRDPGAALAQLRRAEDEYAHAGNDEQPSAAAFFNDGAMQTNAARVHSTLALRDENHLDLAIPQLRAALDQDPQTRARQRAFNLAWMATCSLAAGDTTGGVAYGNDAVEAARRLRSVRIVAHLEPLRNQAARHSDSDARHLVHEIGTLSPVA